MKKKKGKFFHFHLFHSIKLILSITNHRKEVERLQKENNAVSIIIRSYRRYLRKKFYKIERDRELISKLLQNYAALKITSLCRGRLARRQYITEIHLKNIRNSHPLLIQHAIKNNAYEAKCFWYTKKIELELLYNNYLELVMRSGYQPPRYLVEQNIKNISEKINKKKNYFIIKIQKNWRLFITKRIYKIFILEIKKIYNIFITKSIKIQKIFRGYYIRVRLKKLLKNNKNNNILKLLYNKNYHRNNLIKNKAEFNDLILRNYKKEREEEKTLRYISRLPYATETINQNGKISNSYFMQSIRQNNQTQNLIFNELTNQFSTEHHDDFDNFSLISGLNSSTSLSSTGYLASSALKLKQIPAFKMNLYRHSLYSDPKIMKNYMKLIKNDNELIKLDREEIEEDKNKQEFIRSRIQERGPIGYGKRSGDIDSNYIPPSSSTSLPAPLKNCSRSKGMYEYYEKELKEIHTRTIKNSFKNNRLLSDELSKNNQNKIKNEIKKYNQIYENNNNNNNNLNQSYYFEGDDLGDDLYEVHHVSNDGQYKNEENPKPKNKSFSSTLPNSSSTSTSNFNASTTLSSTSQIKNKKVKSRKFLEKILPPSDVLNFKAMDWLYNDDEECGF